MRRGSHVWIERPWDMRYFLSIRSVEDWALSKEGAVRRNAKEKESSLEWEGIFDPTVVIAAHSESASTQGFAVVLISFDTMGFVKTKNDFATPLRGRLNRLQYVTLSAGDAPSDRQFDIGERFLGLGDASTHWAPALCDTNQMPSPFSKTDEGYLYGGKYNEHKMTGTFGCREWAFQLYDSDRPYIDVTSYLLTGKGRSTGSRIHVVTGWGRFTEKKPVIGKHGSDWYCFHDCPNDEKPGYIASIAAWAHRSGWPLPKPPTKAPTFPDPPAKQGTYPR